MAFITLNGCSLQTMMSLPQGSMAYPGSMVTHPSHSLHTTCIPHTTPQPWRNRLCSRPLASQYDCSLFRSASVSNWPAKNLVRSRHSSPTQAGQQHFAVAGVLVAAEAAAARFDLKLLASRVVVVAIQFLLSTARSYGLKPALEDPALNPKI